MNQLFYTNFNFDLRFDGVVSPKLRRALAEATTYPLLFGDGNDYAVLDCHPTDSYADFLSRIGLEPPRACLKEHDVPPGLQARPWGWNDDVVALFERVGADRIHPPLAVIEQINARDFSERLGRETGFGVPDTMMCLCPNDVWTYCRQTPHPEFVLKPRHGNAGHGFIRSSSGEPSERIRRRVNAYFQRSKRPGLCAEPWLDRIMDFSSKFSLDCDGGIRDLRTYRTLTTTAGTFQGILLDDDTQWLDGPRELVLASVMTVARALTKEGYFGICGIDSMIVRDQDTQTRCVPLVEINARETFSIIAHELQRRLAPDRICLLSVVPGKYFRLSLDYSTLESRLGRNYFDAKQRTGVLVMSPLLFHQNDQTWLPERILLFSAAHSVEECLAGDRLFRQTFEIARAKAENALQHADPTEHYPYPDNYDTSIQVSAGGTATRSRSDHIMPQNNARREVILPDGKETPNLIVICGPTATGKTRLGVECALRIGGEIISADSRQVYRGMDIGTGKDLDEYSRPEGDITCHLIDIVEPSYLYSIHDFQRDFFRVFSEVRQRARVPILVGGSGLYIETILRSFTLSDVPEVAPFRRKAMSRPKDELLWELAQKAPDLRQRIDCSSLKRIVRALEIATFGNRDTNETDRPLIIPIVVCIAPPREILHQRIHRRLAIRLEQGLVEEVRHLVDSGVTAERFEMLGMEYRFVARFLHGTLDYETMVVQLERAIRKLAKRQLTWFRGMARRGIHTHWLAEPSLDEVLEIVDRSGLRYMK